MNPRFVVGVDAGTGSVRAGVFDLKGFRVGYGARDITLWQPEEHFVEQSSVDIWSAACAAVREALASGGIAPEEIAGISFDATCSLVALDPDSRPLTVSLSGDPRRNIIVWMDHRARTETATINASGHRLLRFVGGRMSPEMEPPKLLWIKRHLPDTWKRAGKFLDLADFLVYRASGNDVRSLCTTTCKWAFDGVRGSWDTGFYGRFGMARLLREGMIGTTVVPMGTPAGPLSPAAARELGLTTSTTVATGIIDAHAGGVGVLGMGQPGTPRPADLEKVLALIGGTSSCHMAVSRAPKFIKGIWGPYRSAMIPGLWLTEGGQSATGSLLDHMIRNNASHDRLMKESAERKQTVYEFLNAVIADLKKKEHRGADLTADLHVLPYVLGNRSPRADPDARGMLVGLGMDESIDTVARWYYATIQAIAYGTRHIIEKMNAHGYSIRRIHACGGGTKNPLWVQEHADITGCEIVLPREPEAVLLGTAMIAAVGAGAYRSITEAAARMSGVGDRVRPDRSTARFHGKKFKVFKTLYADQKKYKRILTQ